MPRSGPRASPVAGSLCGTLRLERRLADARDVVPRSKCGWGAKLVPPRVLLAEHDVVRLHFELQARGPAGGCAAVGCARSPPLHRCILEGTRKRESAAAWGQVVRSEPCAVSAVHC